MRPQRTPGKQGKISVRQNGEAFIARCRYTRVDGTVTHLQASAPSEAGALRALTERIADLKTDDGVDKPLTVKDAAMAWLEYRKREGHIKKQSLEAYEGVINANIGYFAHIQIKEATTPVLQTALDAIAVQRSPEQAARIRMILRQMFDHGARRGWNEGNPVNQTLARKKATGEPVSLTLEQARMVRNLVKAWSQPGVRKGPHARNTLMLGVDILLGTGMRAGELCALRWEDIDLEKRRITINATIARVNHRDFYQASPKSPSSRRSLFIPDLLAETLQENLSTGFVLATKNGTFTTPANFRRSLRSALKGSVLEPLGITPHTFRRTVATFINNEESIDAATSQLGHVFNTTTQKYYVTPFHEGPEIHVLNVLLEDDAPVLRVV